MQEHMPDVLFSPRSFGPNETRSALVSVSIESALLATGVDIYEKVSKLLMNDYECHILNCYQHPEYLNEVLLKFDDDIRHKVLELIRKDLGQYSYMTPIQKFLNLLCE